jgi:hypothetical protein
MTAAKLLVARENFMAATKDGEVFVNAGTRVQANHPLAKAHPQLFEPAEPKPDLEQPVKRRRKP